MPRRRYWQRRADSCGWLSCRIFDYPASSFQPRGQFSEWMRLPRSPSDRPDRVYWPPHEPFLLTSLSQIPVLDGVVCTFRSRNNDYFVEFLQELKNYAPTGGLREQLLGYLRESGVKEEYMKKIVSILKKD